MMRTIPLLVAALLLLPAMAVGADVPEPNYEEIQTFSGTVGCSAGILILSVTDRCRDNVRTYGPSHDGVVSMNVTFAYEGSTGTENLAVRWAGPPTGSLTGASPVTASYGNSTLPDSAFTTSLEVRAVDSVAVGVAWNLTIVFTYAAPIPAPEPEPEPVKPEVETVVYEGVVGCSAAAGPIAIQDACADNIKFPYGPSFDGIVFMTATLEYESPTGLEALAVRWGGPPTGALSGPSGTTATYNNSTLPDSAFDATFEVRASAFAARNVAWTLSIDYSYVEATVEAPTPIGDTETVVYEGVVGCTVAVGPVSQADRCTDDFRFAYGPGKDGIVFMQATLTYEDNFGEDLLVRWNGPPTGAFSGPSGTTATYDNSTLPNKTFHSFFEVRVAGPAFAVDVPWTLEILYSYVEAEGAGDEGGEQPPVPDSERLIHHGVLGCSAGAGPVKVSDRCGGRDNFAIAPRAGVESMEVTLFWTSATGAELGWAFAGPPGQNNEGASPLTATYDDFTIDGPWDGSITIRAATGVAVNQPFTLVIEYDYV